jgi:hypothetical protein
MKRSWREADLSPPYNAKKLALFHCPICHRGVVLNSAHGQFYLKLSTSYLGYQCQEDEMGEGTYHFHLQGKNQPSKKPECSRCLANAGFLLGWFLPWRWRWYLPLKHRLTYGLRDAISQKIATFITTAVRTSNPTSWAQFQKLCRMKYLGRLTILLTLQWIQESFLYITAYQHFADYIGVPIVHVSYRNAAEKQCYVFALPKPCLYKFHRFTLWCLKFGAKNACLLADVSLNRFGSDVFCAWAVSPHFKGRK